MGKKIDLVGMIFGFLTVVGEGTPDLRGNLVWLCRCVCGKIKPVAGRHLNIGNTKSCGCLRNTNLDKIRIKHGGRRTRLYGIWSGIKARCNNTNASKYHYYGGRGITICPEWLEFASFRDWANLNGYQDHLSIDRIDNNKGYSPDNCRWATIEAQANNKRSNVRVIYEGEIYTSAQLSRKLGISTSYVCKLIKLGKLNKETTNESRSSRPS